MASFGKKTNVNDVDTSQSDFSPLPEGIYGLEVVESDYKEQGNGKKAEFKCNVLAPQEYEGRTFYISEWGEHTTPQAQDIGNRNIGKLAKACELEDYENTEEFHFRPFVAKIGFGKPYPAKKDGVLLKDENGNQIMRQSNEVKRYYYPSEGEVPQPFVDAGAVVQKPAPAANDNRAAANDNSRATPAAAAAGGAKKARPWG